MDALIRRAPVTAFFVLTFAASWLIWLVTILFPGLPFSALYLLTVTGASMPSFIGFLLSGRLGGRPGARELWRRFTTWRVSIGWYAYAVLLPVALCLVTLGVYMLLGHPAPEFTMLKQYGLFLPLIALQVFLMGGPVQEEFGWRGFALPRLQEQFDNVSANLVLGALWALWHTPLFWVSISTQRELPLGWFLLQPIGLSFLMAYMYNHTKGSLLLATLFHMSTNVTFAMLSLSPAASGSTLPFTIAVLTVLVAGAVVAVPLARSKNPGKGSNLAA